MKTENWLKEKQFISKSRKQMFEKHGTGKLKVMLKKMGKLLKKKKWNKIVRCPNENTNESKNSPKSTSITGWVEAQVTCVGTPIPMQVYRSIKATIDTPTISL